MRLEVDRPLILNLTLSPAGLALFSTAIFGLAVCFPPRLFSSLLAEPDLVFADVQTITFFVACVCGFYAGLLLFELILPSQSLLASELKRDHWNAFALVLPLVFTTLVTCAEVAIIARTYPNLLSLLLTQEGDAVKQEAQLIQLGPLAVIDFMHVGVLWWTFTKARIAGLTRSGRLLTYTVITAGLLAKIALCVLLVSRAALMPVIGGLFVLYLAIKIQQKEFSTRKLLTMGAGFITALLAVFLTLGLLRGGGDPAQAGADFLGYTLASYNRLAALVHGTMRYPYGGHGVYLSNYLAYDKRINYVLPLNKSLHWPNFLDLWASEFQAPQLAGLNPNLIWSGAFGYLFSDFGWATPLVLAAYGLLYGAVWKSFKAGRTLGYILYPWFAYCVLSWFSVNLLLDNALFVLFVTALLLTAYQKMVCNLHLRLV